MLSNDAHQAAYGRFLAKVRKARLEAKLTQAEVARLLGKPQSFVSKIESGERRLDFVEAESFAHIYGKDLNYFRAE